MPTTRLKRPQPEAEAPSNAPAPRAEPAAQPVHPADLVTPAQAADLLTVNAKVLERWRGTGEGPAFVRLSSKTIRYRHADLDAFVAGRIRASTAR